MPVVVLGMHRSGTSAVTRALSLLGLPVGDEDDLIPPRPDNQKGFWESRSLAVLNDRLLAALGGAWDRPPVLGDDWRDRVAPAADEARRLFARVHGTSEWIWKDPRNSVLLRFWREVLGVNPVQVLVYRNPLEVWRSLETRNGISAPVALALWEYYSRMALESVAGRPTLVVSYADFMADPGSLVRTAERFFGAHGVSLSDGDPEAAAGFADAALRHTRLERADLEAHAAVSPEQLALFDLLESLKGTHDAAPDALLPEPTPWAGALLAERRAAAAIRPATKAATVVVASQDQAAALERTLHALAAHTSPSLYDLVFVDDASQDGTAELLSCVEGDVRTLVNAEPLGQAAARNQGAMAARGEVVVFVSPGAEPKAGWLEALLSSVGKPGVAAAGACMVASDGAVVQAGFDVVLEPDDLRLVPRTSAVSADVEALGPDVLAVRRDVFAALAGFTLGQPLELACAEWSLRARAAGLRLRSERDAVAVTGRVRVSG